MNNFYQQFDIYFWTYSASLKVFLFLWHQALIFFFTRSDIMIPAILIITPGPKQNYHTNTSLFNLTAKSVCLLSYFSAYTCTISNDYLKFYPSVISCLCLSPFSHFYLMRCIQSRWLKSKICVNIYVVKVGIHTWLSWFSGLPDE